MKVFIASLLLPTVFCLALHPASSNNHSADRVQPLAIATENPLKELIKDYLMLKNALVRDDDHAAAAAGNKMVKAFHTFKKNQLTAAQAKVYALVVGNAKENAEHIGRNAGNIEHQREHFGILSKEIFQLVKATGARQKLYYDHCPMYNKGKGANWISENREIKNPYFGKSMTDCGSAVEEL